MGRRVVQGFNWYWIGLDIMSAALMAYYGERRNRNALIKERELFMNSQYLVQNRVLYKAILITLAYE